MQNKLKKLHEFSNSWTGTIIIVLLIIFFIAQAFVIPSGSMKETMKIGDHLFVKKFSYGIPTPHLPWVEVPVLPDFDGDGHLIEGDKPQRGDIVIFRFPLNHKMHYVKRCVATGGDEILYRDKELYIHFKEGDAFMVENYDKSQLTQINGKFWVLNPYMKDHPFIQYDQELDLFDYMLRVKATDPDMPMHPVLIDGFESFKRFMGMDVNFFYYKVPEEEYFMVGDNRDHSNDSRFWGPVKYSAIIGTPWFIYFSWDDAYQIDWSRMFRTVEGLEEDARGE
jgi:signal peptidase I